jgi:hypothetical protein
VIAELLFQGQRSANEAESEAVVDHREAARGKRNAPATEVSFGGGVAPEAGLNCELWASWLHRNAFP